MSATCDRCLSGRHRCLTGGCACSCNGPTRKPRPVAGGVLRSPKPARTPKATAPMRPTPFQLVKSRAFAAEVARLEQVIHG